MKFAFTGDIHLSRYSQDKIEDETNLPERLHSIKRSLYEIGNYCREHDIKTFVIGGDIYHGKSIIYAIAQDILINFFDDFSDLLFWVIDGNHDLSGKSDREVSALKPISKCKNVEWITQIPIIPHSNVTCIPYSYDVVNQVKNNSNDILISHFGLTEGMLNSGMSIVSDISVKDLIGKYKLVLLAHYHRPQEIIRPGFSLYYVGSSIQLDWGEKNDEKRFLIVDTDNLEVESIPLTEYKKHIEIELTKDNYKESIEFARLSKESGDHVKLIMKEKIDISEIQDIFRVIDKTEQDITDRGITNSMSMTDKFEKYLDIKEVPKELHKEYIELAAQIIESCEEI